MEYFKEIIWMINMEYDEAIMRIDNGPIPQNILDKQIFAGKKLPDKIPIHCKVPIQRDCLVYDYISLTPRATVRDILMAIYHFYNNLTISPDLLEIIPNDTWLYRQNALEKIKKNLPVYYIELIGDMVYFEDIQFNGFNAELILSP